MPHRQSRQNAATERRATAADRRLGASSTSDGCDKRIERKTSTYRSIRG